MKETYILRIDHLCKSCMYRNKIETVTDYKVEVVACGKCGRFIMVSKETTRTDLKNIVEVINRALDGGT